MNLRYFLFRFSSMVDDNQIDKKSRCIAKLASSNKILPLEFSNPSVLIIKKRLTVNTTGSDPTGMRIIWYILYWNQIKQYSRMHTSESFFLKNVIKDRRLLVCLWDPFRPKFVHYNIFFGSSIEKIPYKPSFILAEVITKPNVIFTSLLPRFGFVILFITTVTYCC